MKTILMVDTYVDVTTPWIVARLRSDDSVVVEYRSRWQGTIDGRTILHKRTGLCEAISDAQDPEVFILEYLRKIHESGIEGRCLRRGHIVR